MSKQTNEHAFETQVEETLLGVSGWQSGTALLHDSTLARVRPFSQPLVHDTTA